eukprot:gb/GEZN01014606.1/.p1 GENE.gb/GEZN01014606.1/~~gb/GEZN01014606.1/.p1  ORF type:complete len:192 (+),score=25.25 gb/GEZN01014606.1/:39-614(+)
MSLRPGAARHVVATKPVVEGIHWGHEREYAPKRKKNPCQEGCNPVTRCKRQCDNFTSTSMFGFFFLCTLLLVASQSWKLFGGVLERRELRKLQIRGKLGLNRMKQMGHQAFARRNVKKTPPDPAPGPPPPGEEKPDGEASAGAATVQPVPKKKTGLQGPVGVRPRQKKKPPAEKAQRAENLPGTDSRSSTT